MLPERATRTFTAHLLEMPAIAPDVRTPALSMLGLVRDSKPVIVIAATPNLPARMFGRSIAFALGLNMDVLDTRDEALKRIALRRRRSVRGKPCPDYRPPV